MIAVAVSLFFALYVVGPDAFSRVILGFTVPRRTVQLSKGEEVSRALVWSVATVGAAYFWARADGSLARTWNPALVRAWFSGIYSEAFFRANGDLWFASLRAIFDLNRCLLIRTYAVVLLLSVVLSVLTHFYGVIRDALPRWNWLRKTFAAVVLPRVAQWHLVLSKLLLGDRSLSIHIDILTKSDKLYQGAFADKALAGDGSLVSITLANPKRFDRPAYQRAKDRDPDAKSEAFWKEIPTNMFLIMGSEIHTINLRYLPRNLRVRPLKRGSPDLTDLLRTIGEQVKAAQKQAADLPKVTVADSP